MVLAAAAALAACGAPAAAPTDAPVAAGAAPAAGAVPAAAPQNALSTADVDAALVGAGQAGTPAGTTDWPTYHGDAARTGYSSSTPAVGRLHRAWAAPLDAAVYAAPIVVGSTVIAATERNSVYGLDRASGKVRWHTRLGTPVDGGSLSCGNIDPLGITGTPAYDAATGRVFVVKTTRTGAVRHQLVGLAAQTGKVQVRRDIDPPRQATDVLNQRGALAVSNGKVYVAFGGLNGDCGDYHGHVVGVSTDGSGPLLSFRVPTPREGGIWAPSGVAVDKAGALYVAVGNGSAGAGDSYDGSNSITKLSPALAKVGLFAPRGWAQENHIDADLGSAGPLLVGDFVWAQGKTSTGYVLRQSRLGGIGGQAATVSGCERQFGGAAAHGLVVYAACTDGVRQIVLGRDGHGRAGWQAPSAVDGSPVVGGGAVFSLATGDGVLYALDEHTGRGRGTVGVGAVSRFATPALSGGLALVPTKAGITAVAVR